MSDEQGDDVIAFMRRQERALLASLVTGPRVIERGFGGIFGDDSAAEHCRMSGYVARTRSHPRCGQDDDPPFIYMLTERGRARLAELDVAPSTVGLAGSDAGARDPQGDSGPMAEA